jgi:fermentation-respiration switch protein FrsA (DUF1100 family)
MKFFKQFAVALILVYLALLTYLYAFQRSLIFHPETVESYDSEALQAQDIEIKGEKGQNWFYLPAAEPSEKTLIYFHGNAGMALGRLNKAEEWRAAGFNVALVEYPGYGANDGIASEIGFYRQGHRVMQYLIETQPEAQFYLYGESIGSGTAIEMADCYDIEGLIIEAGFTSLSAMAYDQYPFVPVDLMLIDRFDNVTKLQTMTEKDFTLYVIHGTLDETVPYEMGLELYQSYPGSKEFFPIDGAAHNNIYDMTDIQAIISEI